MSGSVVTNGTTITFTPSLALSYGTKYTGTVTTKVQAANFAGTTMESNYSWDFTTESLTAVTPTPRHIAHHTNGYRYTCAITHSNGNVYTCSNIGANTERVANGYSSADLTAEPTPPPVPTPTVSILPTPKPTATHPR